jgi:hypothetical protein
MQPPAITALLFLFPWRALILLWLPVLACVVIDCPPLTARLMEPV